MSVGRQDQTGPDQTRPDPRNCLALELQGIQDAPLGVHEDKKAARALDALGSSWGPLGVLPPGVLLGSSLGPLGVLLGSSWGSHGPSTLDAAPSHRGSCGRNGKHLGVHERKKRSLSGRYNCRSRGGSGIDRTYCLGTADTFQLKGTTANHESCIQPR